MSRRTYDTRFDGLFQGQVEPLWNFPHGRNLEVFSFVSDALISPKKWTAPLAQTLGETKIVNIKPLRCLIEKWQNCTLMHSVRSFHLCDISGLLREVSRVRGGLHPRLFGLRSCDHFHFGSLSLTRPPGPGTTGFAGFLRSPRQRAPLFPGNVGTLVEVISASKSLSLLRCGTSLVSDYACGRKGSSDLGLCLVCGSDNLPFEECYLRRGLTADYLQCHSRENDLCSVSFTTGPFYVLFRPVRAAVDGLILFRCCLLSPSRNRATCDST